MVCCTCLEMITHRIHRRGEYIAHKPVNPSFQRLYGLLAAPVLVGFFLAACSPGNSAERRDFETATVKRQDIEVTASATGVIRPVRVVEVKSKASGEIVDLPVESGDKESKP